MAFFFCLAENRVISSNSAAIAVLQPQWGSEVCVIFHGAFHQITFLPVAKIGLRYSLLKHERRHDRLVCAGNDAAYRVDEFFPSLLISIAFQRDERLSISCHRENPVKCLIVMLKHLIFVNGLHLMPTFLQLFNY